MFALCAQCAEQADPEDSCQSGPTVLISDPSLKCCAAGRCGAPRIASTTAVDHSLCGVRREPLQSRPFHVLDGGTEPRWRPRIGQSRDLDILVL
jgi:hypothetical protein